MLSWSESYQLWLPSLCLYKVTWCCVSVLLSPKAYPIYTKTSLTSETPQHKASKSAASAGMTRGTSVTRSQQWGSSALFMGIDRELDGTGLAGCQGTETPNQIQARRVTEKVNVAASRKREHINKPQTVKMSQKGLWVPTNPPILLLQPQQHSCPSSMLKGSPSLRPLAREAGLCALPCQVGRVLSFLCRAEGWEGTTVSKVMCPLDLALCGGLALVFPACVWEGAPPLRSRCCCVNTAAFRLFFL